MTTETQNLPGKTTKPPVAKLRSGRVTANIWEVEGKKGTFHTVTFERSYRVKDGWKTTHSYRVDHLADISALVSMTMEKIVELSGGLDAYVEALAERGGYVGEDVAE